MPLPLLAGMTSEGGGAVAFPVMTLAFKVAPSVARDFSVMIQSCGMTAASLSILYMRIHVERNALIFCSVGGVIGAIVGLHSLDQALSPAQKKMFFVSIWFSFAFALFMLNRQSKRRVFHDIPRCGAVQKLVLVVVGCCGGLFTSFAGSGLDICSFSVLTLLFRVSEKVATPTSVILMAGNSLVVFLWRWVVLGMLSDEAWQFLTVCIPIVVIGAPCGSVLGTHFHRLVLAALVYVIDIVALVGAFAIVPQTPLLTGVSCGIIVFGVVFFFCLTKLGSKILEKYEIREQSEADLSKYTKNEKSEGNLSTATNTSCLPDSAITLSSLDTQPVTQSSLGTQPQPVFYIDTADGSHSASPGSLTTPADRYTSKL